MKAAAQALRDNPSWARQPPAWFKVALWAFRYSEEVPDRNDIARALVATRYGPRAPDRKDIAA
jgi:hypothetical protein